MKWLIDFLKGKWLKHPLHPIVVHVPMAMWPAKVDLKTFKVETREGKIGVLFARDHDQKN